MYNGLCNFLPMLDNKRAAKPPVGETPNLDKMETNRLLSLPFESFRKRVELSRTMESANTEMNAFRKRFGLPSLVLHSNDVRIVDRTAYDQDPTASEYGKEGGHFLTH